MLLNNCCPLIDSCIEYNYKTNVEIDNVFGNIK